MTGLWAASERQGTYVLSGQPVADGWDAQLWYSNDARLWQLAALPDQPHIDRIHAIAPTGNGFAALGLELNDTEFLTHALISTDGLAWKVAGSYPGVGSDLAEIDGRLLAFNNDNSKSDPVYSDDDGITWHVVSSPSGLVVADGLLALYETEDYLWALRSDDPTEDARIKTPIELWRTTDGLDWSEVVELPDSMAASKAEIASGPLGWVITARRATFTDYELSNEWSAWSSADGLVWRPAVSAPQYVDQILADDQGFIAIGRDPGKCCVLEESNVRQNIWTSADGRSWHQMSQQGWHGREIDYLTSVGTQLEGVGIDWKFWPSRDSVGWGVAWEANRSDLLP
ncbi:MAG TPA: hypothetical protein VH371_09220 [Candidatus Limnocylindrales bacterium]